jgi:hypothetical protein
MSFEYNGWTISEEYNYNEKFPKDSEYRLVVSSLEIRSKDKLSETASKGREVTELITKMLPYVAFVSLNEPLHTNTSRTRYIISTTKPLNGWNNNYEEIETELDKNDDNPLRVKCSLMATIHWVRVPKSPMEELKIVLENYNSLSDSYKFLIFLHNAIKESEDINRYMLIGKALEIVNTIYPYERHRGKDDDRIERFHPELAPIFGKITLKDLMEWSNNRQETRHYMRNLKDSHPRLTEEEREKLYLCSVLLITNIIRKVCGLEVQTFIQE